MMLSRVADRLYWMARYLERTENTARLINVHSSLLMDLPESMEIDWYTLIKIFNAEETFSKHHKVMDEINVMQFMIADRDNMSSIMTSFSGLRENVRTSLDLLPDEAWEQVNQTYIKLQASLSTLNSRHSRQALLRNVMSGCQRIRGVLDSHMSRDHAYDFMQIGKHIERTDMTSRTLEMTALLLSDARSEALRRYDSIVWSGLLSALGARQMYLRHKNSRIEGSEVMDFLVCDRIFPRSLTYSLAHIDQYLARLPEPEAVRTISMRLLEQFEEQDIRAIPVNEIASFMDSLQAELTTLHNKIGKQWFYPELDISQYRQEKPVGQKQSQVQY